MNIEQQVRLTRYYCDQAAREWETIHEGGVSIPLTDLYVMLQARHERQRTHPHEMSDLSADPDRLAHAGMEARGDEFERSVTIGEALSGNERLVILGEPGSGKSTTLQFIGLYYAGGVTQEKLNLAESHVPVLLELGLYARKIVEGDLWTVIETRVRKWLPAPDKEQAGALLLEWQKAGRLLVLLDGLDEVSPDLRRDVIRRSGRWTAIWVDAVAALWCLRGAPATAITLWLIRLQNTP